MVWLSGVVRACLGCCDFGDCEWNFTQQDCFNVSCSHWGSMFGIVLFVAIVSVVLFLITYYLRKRGLL